MDHLPVFMAVSGRPVLVVGGGPAALAKARLLTKAGATVTVVAPRLTDAALAAMAEVGTVAHYARPFAAADVTGATVVISATGNAGVDAAVAAAARAANVPVNVVDNQALCDFIIPAIIDRSPIVVGVSSGGASPVLARNIRAAIERALPRRIGLLARFAAQFRGAVKANIANGPARRRFWERVLDGPVGEAVLRGDDVAAREQMLTLVNTQRRGADVGTVALVGAGPGDPDLLTLRAHGLLQTADVIVYDRLVSPQVLDYARRDAELLFVGKQPGKHSQSQDKINALLVRLAREGKRVVRLKGGDPAIFARGGEELDHLRAHAVAVEIVPGITAATAAAAAAGFSLTHRDHASSVTFVTGQGRAGQGRDGLPDLDWPALARARHTLAIYMGVGAAPEIAQRLLTHGRDPATPAVVVERASTPDQQIQATTLQHLAATVAAGEAGAPALIIVGEVAADADAARAAAADWPIAVGW